MEKIDLLIDRRDLSSFSNGNELRLLAQLGGIKSSAASIDRPADPEIAKIRKKASVQAKQDNATASVVSGLGGGGLSDGVDGSDWHDALHATGVPCFFDNPVCYLLALIAFLLFLLLITRE